MEQCFVAIWGLVSTKAVMQEHLFLEMLYKRTFRQSLCVIYDKRSARTNCQPGAGHSQCGGFHLTHISQPCPLKRRLLEVVGDYRSNQAVNHDLDIHLLPPFLHNHTIQYLLQFLVKESKKQFLSEKHKYTRFALVGRADRKKLSALPFCFMSYFGLHQVAVDIQEATNTIRFRQMCSMLIILFIFTRNRNFRGSYSTPMISEKWRKIKKV